MKKKKVEKTVDEGTRKPNKSILTLAANKNMVALE